MQSILEYSLLTALLCCASISIASDEVQPVPESHQALKDGVLLGDWSQLDPHKKPGENFDLLDWSLTLPTDLNKDKKADTIFEKHLSGGLVLHPLFYTAPDGGMVFASPNQGAKTSKNTKYSRSELWEMLRRGNLRIKTKGITKNNWVYRYFKAGVYNQNNGGEVKNMFRLPSTI